MAARLNDIEATLKALLASELGYNVDPDEELSVFELPDASYPCCVIQYGDEEEEPDEEVPAGYFQADIELILNVLLPSTQSTLRFDTNEERAKLKRFVARNCQFAEGVVELYLKGSALGRTGRDTPPVGGLAVRLGLRYREPRDRSL